MSRKKGEGINKKPGGRKQGKQNINNSSKRNQKNSSNRKRFVGKFPHIPNEISKRYFQEHGPKEGVKMLGEYDFDNNFKKQYYDKFKRIRLGNRYDEEDEGENDQVKSKHKCTFREIKGDLFSCPEEESLCHCVSQDLKMSAGIAVLFVKKFGQRGYLVEQKKKVGEVIPLRVKDRFVFYMISKSRFFMIPSYENLYKTLVEMRNLCEVSGVRKLSMPKIACGLDRLNWNIVKEMIIEAFYDYRIDITCYRL